MNADALVQGREDKCVFCGVSHMRTYSHACTENTHNKRTQTSFCECFAYTQVFCATTATLSTTLVPPSATSPDFLLGVLSKHVSQKLAVEYAGKGVNGSVSDACVLSVCSLHACICNFFTLNSVK